MKKNILVVDDELNIRELCKDILEDEGYKVTLASDGFEALRMMDAEYSELFIVDMIMPGMDGLELLQKIRKRQPLAVVIITTGFSSIEGAVKAVHAGAFQYLSKPLHADELIETVSKGVSYSQKLYGPLQEAFHSPASNDFKEKVSARGNSKILFHGLPQTIIKKMTDLGKIKKFDRGESIVTSSNGIEHLLLISSGEVSVWSENISIDYLRKGDCWGEEEFLITNSGFTNLRAETPVEILYFLKDDLTSILKGEDEILEKKFRQNLTKC